MTIPDDPKTSPRPPAAGAVKGFVRDALGCTCPDSVFDRVTTERDVQVGASRLQRRINVGRRLLLYLLQCDDAEETISRLPGLVAQGRAERDQSGFNRLRIVLATSRPEGVLAAARRALRSAPERDARVHVHVVGKEAIRGL